MWARPVCWRSRVIWAMALSIGDDIGFPEPMAQARAAGAKLMLSLNASPFHLDKQLEREEVLAERVAEGEIPVIYVNQVGGQDELVFDGGSCVMHTGGMICQRAPAFVEGLYRDWPDSDDVIQEISPEALAELMPTLASGMVPKMEACLQAVTGGVAKATVVDGREPHSVLLELFTDEGIGTQVLPGVTTKIRKALA